MKIKNLLLTISFIVFTNIQLFAVVGDGSLTDSNIQYIGRWDKSNASTFHSYWGGAYFRVSFTGTTVKIKLAGSANIFVNIDGKGVVKFPGANGTVNLTPTPLSEGTHTLVVAANFQNDEIQFQGLILDAGAKTVEQPQKDIIEFIGNSITTGDKTTKGDLSAFPWHTGEELGCDHTQISYSGITLVDGYRYTYNGAPYWGQSVQYFWMKRPNYSPNIIWDYTLYTPKIIVVMLGQNDKGCKVPTELFISTYTDFLNKLHIQYPSTEIFALRTFSGAFSSETQNIVDQLISEGNDKLHFINSEGWLISSDFVDGIHPTDAGHLKVKDRLVPILNMYLTNGIHNSDFELDNGYSQNLLGWKTLSNNATESSDYIEANNAYSGSFKLVHSNNKAYNVYTYQTIKDLANGSYTFSAWVRSSGGQNNCSMIAKDFGGETLELSLPTTDTWTKISINNIPITNGQCEIGFSSDSPADKWCNVDNVSFSQENVNLGTKNIHISNENSNDLQIYPNPTKDYITIKIKKMENAIIQIVDIKGSELYQTILSNNCEMNLKINNLLSPGIYFVNAIDSNRILTKRLIVD